ncbi:MAG TPA: hypothetical protein VFS43_04335 [Polyangiaceae bacterium]|nr:hypothetical protein [Polyangiaceae bacterium]
MTHVPFRMPGAPGSDRLSPNVDPSLPTAQRRHDLALFYAKLANDLVAWRQRNPGQEPEAGNAPVVWKIHASFLEHEYFAPAQLVDWRAVAERVNREVLEGEPGVVGAFRLRAAEAERLYALMCEHENAALAPYEPDAMAGKW